MLMPNILTDIVRQKGQEVSDRKAKLPGSMLERGIEVYRSPSFEEALRKNFQTYILEIKPASPSGGVFHETLHDVDNLRHLLSCYHEFASALSVLTDTTFFQGSFELLTSVVHNTTLPVLCKDFIFDPYQVYEARKAGASAILLIVKILTDTNLIQLSTLAKSLGMTPVIEIQNQEELNRALIADPTVLLINNRNLDTMAVSLETTLKLAPLIPEGVLRISASGIESREDINRLSAVCSSFLIGSAFMRAQPELLASTLREMLYA